MNTEYGVLFKALDEYVRKRHHCFVSECFLNPHTHDEWVICARQTEDNAHIRDRYACKYFRLSLKEVEEICNANELSDGLRGRIDCDLRAITDRQT